MCKKFVELIAQLCRQATECRIVHLCYCSVVYQTNSDVDVRAVSMPYLQQQTMGGSGGRFEYACFAEVLYGSGKLRKSHASDSYPTSPPGIDEEGCRDEVE